MHFPLRRRRLVPPAAVRGGPVPANWAAIRPVELTAAAEQHAGRLTGRHALRGADAVHLASALAIADPDLVLAVRDRRLHAGATAAGLRVAPAQLNWDQTPAHVIP